MDRLIELLNKYEQLNMCRKFDSFELHTFEDSGGVDRLLEDTVISARYGFTKRLIKNNKIDISKLGKKSNMGFGDKYTREETLLMLLSISDTPINDLISYLK